jgi:type I restriction enzyme S subunit
MIPLGEVAEFINGAAFKPEDWHENGRKIIRIQNLNDSSKPYNLTTRNIDKKYEVNTGDILVSWSASLGVFEWLERETALLNQHIFKVIPDKSKVNKNYLKYSLDKALNDMECHLHGATMKHVNRKEFLETKIYLPPLEEQRRIAAILDKADGVRRKHKEAIRLTEELLKSTFLEMFGDPVTNPKGWEIKTIEDITVNQKGAIKRGPFGGALKKDIFTQVGFLVYEQYHALNNDFSFERYYIDEDKFGSSGIVMQIINLK